MRFAVLKLNIINPTKSNRNDATARQYRALAQEKAVIEKKASKMKRLEAQLQQHQKKQDSIQQFRHEVNRALADKRVLEKRFEQVSSALEDSRRRYCLGDLNLCVFCRFENQHYQSHKIQQERRHRTAISCDRRGESCD